MSVRVHCCAAGQPRIGHTLINQAPLSVWPTSTQVPTQFVHTLNATACAVPRMIVAILENNQQVGWGLGG